MPTPPITCRAPDAVLVDCVELLTVTALVVDAPLLVTNCKVSADCTVAILAPTDTVVPVPKLIVLAVPWLTPAS